MEFVTVGDALARNAVKMLAETFHISRVRTKSFVLLSRFELAFWQTATAGRTQNESFISRAEIISEKRTIFL